MKRALISTLTLAAGAAVLHIACSSEDTNTTTSDAGATSSSTSGGGSTSATSGAPEVVDTCRPAGGTCLCDCKLTGQTEDKSKKCVQRAGGNGECTRVCCTGEGNGSTSSSGTTTSSSGADSGDEDGG